MHLEKSIDRINQRCNFGNANEHAFRGNLQALFETLVPTIRANNEPKKQNCGASYYILSKKIISVGFIEAKCKCCAMYVLYKTFND